MTVNRKILVRISKKKLKTSKYKKGSTRFWENSNLFYKRSNFKTANFRAILKTDLYYLDLLVYCRVWTLLWTRKAESVWRRNIIFVWRVGIFFKRRTKSFTIWPGSYIKHRISDNNLPTYILCNRVIWQRKKEGQGICKGIKYCKKSKFQKNKN